MNIIPTVQDLPIIHIYLLWIDLSKTGIKYRGAIVWNIITESGINLNVSESVFN